MDEREDLVRVAPVAVAEVGEGEAHRAQLALRDDLVARRVEDRDAHAVDDLLVHLPLVPRRPGEVVHVLLQVPLDPPPRFERRVDRRARRADDELLRHVERHVVRAVVRVELGEVVKREVRPAPVRLEPRDLREPLPDHVEALPVPGALDDRGELVVPRHVDLDLLPGRDLAR